MVYVVSLSSWENREYEAPLGEERRVGMWASFTLVLVGTYLFLWIHHTASEGVEGRERSSSL